MFRVTLQSVSTTCYMSKFGVLAPFRACNETISYLQMSRSQSLCTPSCSALPLLPMKPSRFPMCMTCSHTRCLISDLRSDTSNSHRLLPTCCSFVMLMVELRQQGGDQVDRPPTELKGLFGVSQGNVSSSDPTSGWCDRSTRFNFFRRESGRDSILPSTAISGVLRKTHKGVFLKYLPYGCGREISTTSVCYSRPSGRTGEPNRAPTP